MLSTNSCKLGLNFDRTSNLHNLTSYVGKWDACALTLSLHLYFAYSAYSPYYNFLIARKTLSPDSIFTFIINLQSILYSSFLVSKLILSTSIILKSTMLLRTYLYFVTAFLSLSFCFISKLNLISGISFNSVPYTLELLKLKLFSELFYLCLMLLDYFFMHSYILTCHCFYCYTPLPLVIMLK